MSLLKEHQEIMSMINNSTISSLKKILLKLHTSKKGTYWILCSSQLQNSKFGPQRSFLLLKKPQIFIFSPYSEIYCWTEWPVLILSCLSMDGEPEVLMCFCLTCTSRDHSNKYSYSGFQCNVFTIKYKSVKRKITQRSVKRKIILTKKKKKTTY